MILQAREKEKFERGTQIVKIPDYIKERIDSGDLSHNPRLIDEPGVEFGFVWSMSSDGNSAYCRYWNKKDKSLRTLSTSELTPASNLYRFVFVSSLEVERAIETILMG